MITVPLNKIAITPIFDADISRGGIIIPEVAKERCDQGIIKYVGDNVKGLKPGDYVLFPGWSGTLIALEGEGNLIIMLAKDVRAILHPPETEIDGLYFKIKQHRYSIQDKIPIPDVLNQDGAYKYIPATYEMVANLLADTFQNIDFFKSIRIKNQTQDKSIIGGEGDNRFATDKEERTIADAKKGDAEWWSE